MSIWTTAPQVSKVPTLPPNTQVDQSIVNMYAYVKEMANVMTSMKNDLEFMINGHLDANNIRANSIETKNLKAGAVTAEKITVTELSAISADLGHITAGLIESIQIFSSYFGTRNGTFPLCEIDSTTNRIRSAYTDTDFIALEPAFGGSPSLSMSTSLNDTSLSSDGSSAYLQTNRDLRIYSDVGSIYIKTDFGSTEFQDFYSVFDQSTSESLQQKLDNLSASIGGLASAISSLDARVTALETP